MTEKRWAGTSVCGGRRNQTPPFRPPGLKGHRLLSLDLRRGWRHEGTGSPRRDPKVSASVPQTRPAHHRRHGHQEASIPERGIPLRGHHAPTRKPGHDHDVERYEFNVLLPLGRSVLQINPVWIRLGSKNYGSTDPEHLVCSDNYTSPVTTIKPPHYAVLFTSTP